MNVGRWYEPDALVVNDPDEDVVQVSLMSVWHRRLPDLSSTACGVPYHSGFAPLRRETLRGDLCRVCFCEYELQVAAAVKAADEADIDNLANWTSRLNKDK